MTDEKNDKETKKTKPKNNTMDITLINSDSKTITASGYCSDIEIKAICKAIKRSGGSTITIA